MRLIVGAALGLCVLLLGATPAAPPDSPVNFIHVDELKALLNLGTKADIIDVRRFEAYVRTHIEGARSIPLRTVAERAGEISRTGLVVFY